MGLYIRQLLAGRDFAHSDYFASRMANFVYLVGDDKERVCMVVDPAWDVEGILNYIDREELKLVGALVTHYHPDHVGGSAFDHKVAGLAELMSLRPVAAHINESEREGIRKVTGLSDSDLVSHSGGDEVMIGGVGVKLLHTPGHTPGSQCFLAGSALISGDTLFIGGCGRVDLPGGDAMQMYYSLTQILAKLSADTLIYPGHNYASKPTSTIGDEKRTNLYMRVVGIDDWRKLMGF